MDPKTRKTLQSLHNLYNKPGTTGEKAAAKAAIDRINKRLPAHEQWHTDEDINNMSVDDILKELGNLDDLFGPDTKLSDGSSIFKTKDEMTKRWAKMGRDAKKGKTK